MEIAAQVSWSQSAHPFVSATVSLFCCYPQSQIHPDTHLHLLHAACSFLFTSLFHCLLLWLVDPRHLNESVYCCLLIFIDHHQHYCSFAHHLLCTLFLKTGTRTLLLHFSGILSLSSIALNNLIKKSTAFSPSYLHTSTGCLSTHPLHSCPHYLFTNPGLSMLIINQFSSTMSSTTWSHFSLIPPKNYRWHKYYMVHGLGSFYASLSLEVLLLFWTDGTLSYINNIDPLCFYSFSLRIYGGTSRRWGHLLGWLHCKEVEPAVSRYHPLLHDVCHGQSARHLHLCHPLPQCAHGWCHSALPVWSED